MKARVGLLTPYSSLTGIGTFTHALTPYLNSSYGGYDFEFTLLVPPHQKLYRSAVNSIPLSNPGENADFLDLFDFLIFNLGNNAQHHDLIHNFLLKKTGVAILHDYVYQHYFAGRTIGDVGSIQTYGALMTQYYKGAGLDVLDWSGVASVNLPTFYAPWETTRATDLPLSEPLMHLASGVIVHSKFSEDYIRPRFHGPLLRLGMPCDQKPGLHDANSEQPDAAVSRLPYLRALSFGHLTANKCLETMIETFARSELLRKGVRYTIAGHPSDRAYADHLASLIDEHGLRNIVTLELSVPERRLTEMMREADFFVNLRHPNTEAASASLAEQMFAGKPSLIYATGCYAEVPQEASIRIERPGDVGEIVSALEAMVRDRNLLVSKGASAREFASRIDSRTYVENLKSFLLEHRDTFERRGNLVNRRRAEENEVEGRWLNDLRSARETFQLLDEKWLPVTTVMDLSAPDAARYFALVLLGVSPSRRLLTFLESFLTQLSPARRYRLASLAYLISAVLAGCAGKHRDRLTELTPIYELDFWRLVERLPDELVLSWTHLALSNGLPQPDDGADTETDTLLARSDRREYLRRALNHWSQFLGLRNRQYSALVEWLSRPGCLTEAINVSAADVPALPADQWLSMRKGSKFLPLMESFYSTERNGAWTNAAGARLVFRLSNVDQPVREIWLRLWSRSTKELGERRLTLAEIYSGAETQIGLPLEWEMREARVTLHAKRKSDHYAIAFVVDKPYNPRNLGVAKDARDLGVYVSEIRIVTDPITISHQA